MIAVFAEEISPSSERSWNLKAESSSIYLNARSAEIALGPIKAAPGDGQLFTEHFITAYISERKTTDQRSPPSQACGVEKGRLAGHIRGMEKTIAIAAVIAIVAFATVYALMAMRKRK